jgi:hypothetical protein
LQVKIRETLIYTALISGIIVIKKYKKSWVQGPISKRRRETTEKLLDISCIDGHLGPPNLFLEVGKMGMIAFYAGLFIGVLLGFLLSSLLAFFLASGQTEGTPD